MSAPVPAPALLAIAVASSTLASLPLGAQVTADYQPVARETILDTNFTFVTPTVGPPIPVTGGVFLFRNVNIPVGRTVRGIGPNPMVWIVTGTFRVDGRLSVDGEPGERSATLQAAHFATRGGSGFCGGGDGGDGSPDILDRSFFGERGYGAFGTPDRGGRGGSTWCMGGAQITGSGGGGGVFGTVGDPAYATRYGWPVLQWTGTGGAGPLSPLSGGAPGSPVFVDNSAENDFFGTGIDFNRRQIILGELAALRGGQGGGGGGDTAISCATGDPQFVADQKGGGGGGGGGCLVILALDRVIIGPNGHISANGGNGGGGEQAGSNNAAGGGGGGSGGMIILAGRRGIELHTKGETFANGDYNFSVSADGGMGSQYRLRGISLGKYPPSLPSAFQASPSGGFGGMGLVQLMAPIGINSDNTNTVLDDRIDVIDRGVSLTGSEKQRYLAWRGWPNASGTPVDDFGNPTSIGGNEGDIRPSPVLLPLF